ncbi:acylneuraminate cytidylyltransferase family protein [Leptospira sp. 201903070]|uniref:Acylneuraminate cytidylyltransferase family protein n=1 Tax=Leptospira ainlahdjerensis TaxID=2810033 RepID=A0ABS2UAB8_9LEPT|nr:acylneuraminate cytidylyltransferase family protein [Leptospira ainlahdjerensis]MBM9577316.1 acylneuraminate cytidylyltransferase family protein [Leptospira ainlahdjerensis]
MNTVAVILARGGSKGLPKKNILDFNGKPLIAWTIEQCLNAKKIDSVWVSSDSDEILSISENFGAKRIKRPDEFSNDTATSESAWIHAIDTIELEGGKVDRVVAPQVTSPLRESSDIEKALFLFDQNGFDSMFSASVAEDLYFWERTANGELNSVNYDWKNRKRRQDHSPQYIENGSFYIFTPETIRKNQNRFGKNIGMVEMEFWKMFEIDSAETFKLCQAIMNSFLQTK